MTEANKPARKRVARKRAAPKTDDNIASKRATPKTKAGEEISSLAPIADAIRDARPKTEAGKAAEKIAQPTVPPLPAEETAAEASEAETAKPKRRTRKPRGGAGEAIDAAKQAAKDAEKAAKDAEKAKIKAAKEAERLVKKAEREEAKAGADKAKADAIREAEKSVKTMARDIKRSLDQAAKMEEDAFDKRLHAAIELAKAKKIVVAAGGRFKEWCERTIETHTYETLRKLAAHGAADDPRASLEGNREDQKKRQQELRERRMAEAAKKSPSAHADEALAGMDEEAVLAYIAAKAEELGIKSKSAKKVSAPTVESVMADFGKLEEADKIKVAEQAAEAVQGYLGFEAVDPVPAGSDMPAIPDFLKR